MSLCKKRSVLNFYLCYNNSQYNVSMGRTTMRVLVIILFSLQLLCAQEMNQKMIISSHLKTEDAAQSLYDVEKFFQENLKLNNLKIKYHLSLGMELLEPYVVITLKPITSTVVKNKLHYFLHSKFPQNFIVDNTQMKKTPKPTINNIKPIIQVMKPKKRKETSLEEIKKPIKEVTINRYAQVKQFWKELDSEWLGLIFLALAGFLLVYRSARQMSKIKALQKEVSKYQTKVESEMNNMGETHA